MSAAPDQPTQEPKPKDSAWGGSAGSNLYLATFLATLFLLLFGSCCIVIRSYMMRRRYRRHLQDIFAAENPGGPHGRCKCRKRRPKFHDRWIARAGSPNWGDIMPLSLRVVFGKRSSKPEDPKPEAKSEPRRLGIKSWRPPVRPSNIRPESAEQTSAVAKFEIAQVSVLIEMPSLERSTLYGRPSSHLKSVDGDDDEAETLPELVIGYARCHKHWWMDEIPDIASPKDQSNNNHRPQ
ncbi:hypothetical protein P691DRAFT_191903 [Macrolepiota fuliginosa MF-IS2]|uniref:Uncharacterized protein n=1 Tax=Macrolepiota fuliginosa MF-IS2 TaxID=1400762 RepID=A0A9P6C747_9AGAR|nr:hypothetical protein P691DRAFT_191903 [Macrolepiota fuliginosa MF-IS2]